MADDLILAHLAGYATISIVLASAVWSGPLGWLAAALLAVGTAVVFVAEGRRRVVTNLRIEAENAVDRRRGASDDAG